MTLRSLCHLQGVIESSKIDARGVYELMKKLVWPIGLSLAIGVSLGLGASTSAHVIPQYVRLAVPGDPVYALRDGRYHWIPTHKIMQGLGISYNQTVWLKSLPAPTAHPLTLFKAQNDRWYWFDAQAKTFYAVTLIYPVVQWKKWASDLLGPLPYPVVGAAVIHRGYVTTIRDTSSSSGGPASATSTQTFSLLGGVAHITLPSTWVGDGSGYENPAGTESVSIVTYAPSEDSPSSPFWIFGKDTMLAGTTATWYPFGGDTPLFYEKGSTSVGGLFSIPHRDRLLGSTLRVQFDGPAVDESAMLDAMETFGWN